MYLNDEYTIYSYWVCPVVFSHYQTSWNLLLTFWTLSKVFQNKHWNILWRFVGPKIFFIEKKPTDLIWQFKVTLPYIDLILVHPVCNNYVSLQEESELRSDGTRSMIKPSHLAVARITCVRGWVAFNCCHIYHCLYVRCNFYWNGEGRKLPIPFLFRRS